MHEAVSDNFFAVPASAIVSLAPLVAMQFMDCCFKIRHAACTKARDMSETSMFSKSQ